MGQRTLAQFTLGFRERDVQRAFTGFRAGHQKMQSDRGFAGAGLTLQQKYMTARQATGEDVIQALDSGGGFFTDQLV